MPEIKGTDESVEEVPVFPLPRLTETSFSSPTTSLPVLTDEGLHEATGTRIAFTNRLGGVSPEPYDALDLSTDIGDVAGAVKMNRRMLLECVGAELMQGDLIVPRQVHGSLVVQVGDIAATRDVVREGADGIVCSKTDVPVLLCFADCTPVISVAPNGMFCIVHAGWRGALAGIAGMGLSKLSTIAGYDPSECNSYIGPHIGACCYEVGSEVLDPFVQKYGEKCRRGEDHLDLSAAVIVSLLRAGAVPERIVDSGVCTSCNTDRYYSYRAEGGKTGRQGALAFREAITWD